MKLIFEQKNYINLIEMTNCSLIQRSEITRNLPYNHCHVRRISECKSTFRERVFARITNMFYRFFSNAR